MKKLTLVSLMCRNKVVMVFLMLPINESGKPFITWSTIDNLFYNYHQFIPTRGETISIL